MYFKEKTHLHPITFFPYGSLTSSQVYKNNEEKFVARLLILGVPFCIILRLICVALSLASLVIEAPVSTQNDTTIRKEDLFADLRQKQFWLLVMHSQVRCSLNRSVKLKRPPEVDITILEGLNREENKQVKKSSNQKIYLRKWVGGSGAANARTIGQKLVDQLRPLSQMPSKPQLTTTTTCITKQRGKTKKIPDKRQLRKQRPKKKRRTRL